MQYIHHHFCHSYFCRSFHLVELTVTDFMSFQTSTNDIKSTKATVFRSSRSFYLHWNNRGSMYLAVLWSTNYSDDIQPSWRTTLL